MKDPTKSESIRSILATVARVQASRPTEPAKEVPPDFQVDLIRPDDLLVLHVAGYNFKPAPGAAGSSLERIDAAKESFLIASRGGLH